MKLIILRIQEDRILAAIIVDQKEVVVGKIFPKDVVRVIILQAIAH